jgi:hypothetical protein
MLENSKGDIIRAVPLSEIEEFIYKGFPSEEDLKMLYENGFILIRIKNDEYYFMDKCKLLGFPFKVNFKMR